MTATRPDTSNSCLLFTQPSQDARRAPLSSPLAVHSGSRRRRLEQIQTTSFQYRRKKLRAIVTTEADVVVVLVGFCIKQARVAAGFEIDE
jgi:hypothetical protein